MKTKIPTIFIAIIFAAFLSLLPIYPLLMEGREISQTGESLYQEWRFVSLAEFSDSEIFARAAWQKSVRVKYIVLKITDYLVLFLFAWICASLLIGLIKKAYPKF